MEIDPNWTAKQTAQAAREQGYGQTGTDVNELPAVQAAHDREAKEWVDNTVERAKNSALLNKMAEAGIKAATGQVLKEVDGVLVTEADHAKMIAEGQEVAAVSTAGRLK